MSDRPGNDPEEQLAEAANALHAIGRACIVVQPTLDVPYTDDPRWSPWTRWVQRPARTAYNLGILLRRQLGISRPPLPQWQSNAATRLYDAARQLSDQTIGHTEACEWHTNGNAYCSCVAYGAACAGVDAVLEALAEVDASEPGPPNLVHSDTSPQASAPPRVDASIDAEACPQHPAASVIALYEQWIKAGPPPLGTSINRWWDRRLAELHNALLNQSQETDHA